MSDCSSRLTLANLKAVLRKRPLLRGVLWPAHVARRTAVRRRVWVREAAFRCE